MKLLTKSTVVLTMLATIAGCGSAKDTESSIAAIMAEQEMIRAQITKNYELESPHFRESNDFYVLGDAFEIKDVQPLPPIFDTPVNVGNYDRSPIDKIFEDINQKFQEYAIVVTVAPDADTYLSSSDSGASSNSVAYTPQDSTTTDILPIQTLAQNTLAPETSEGRYNRQLSMNFENTSLRNMLNLITASTGTWWTYEDGKVQVKYFIEETFDLDIANSAYNITATSSGNEGQGYNLQTTSEAANPLDEFEKELEKYLTKSPSNEGSLAVNKFERTVTVKDTPTAIKRIGKFIKERNTRATTPYAISASLYEVIWESNKDQTIDWTLAFNSSSFGLEALAPTIVTDGVMGSISGTKVGGDFDGTSLLGKFLDSEASAYTKISSYALTKNNIPTQVISSDDQAIVAGRDVTVDSNGFAQQSTTTKIINEGFTIASRPRLTSDGKIDLEVWMNTAIIGDIETFGTEEDMVQLEETMRKSLISGIPLRSGESVVLSAYERDISRAELASLHEKLPWWTGGGNLNKNYKASVILVVKPVILER